MASKDAVPPVALEVLVVDEENPSTHAYEKEQTFAASGGLRICFQDLEYHVASNAEKGSRAYLLKKISGFIEPHQLTALMGPSGSGKTTLLDVLAGRKTAGVTEGVISFGGQKPTPQFLRRYTGYVEQFDTLLGILTVKEMLLYTAEMKRSISEPLSSKQQAVEQLLDKLALVTCKDVVIGSAMVKGISGGQAKRTNIGIGLITNPRVLFLDEPTSGLDSYTSNEVMTVVKSLVADGTTICATIHSPTSYCFNLFDRLLMLVRGEVVYFGPIKESTSFATSALSSVKEMSAGYNEAEFLVDFVTEADRQGRGSELAEHYNKSTLQQTNNAMLKKYLSEKEELPEHIAKELATRSSTTTPWWWGFRTLVKYRTTRNYKDAAFLGPRIGDKVLISLLIMTLYLGIGDDFSSDNYVNMVAVLFMWCCLPAFGAASYVPSLVLERGLFVRERADGMYHVITYLLAKMFDELLLACLCTLPVAAWTFYGIQLQHLWGLFWLVYFITLSNGIVLAYWIAALSPNMDVANALLPTYCVTLLFFGGFLIRLDDIPPWWKWYSYIDFLRYAWGALMVNQFSSPEYGDPVWMNGKTVLEYYALDGVSKWTYVGFLALFFPVFFLLTWVTLSFRNYSNR